jgi:hypothetical protein
MKLTTQITPSLLREARKLAAREGRTLSAVIEDALRQAMAEKRRGAFRLRDASVKGRGLHPEFRDADWETIRDAIYEPRVTKR